MAKNRDPRRGFLARWFHRLRWLRRLVVIGGLVGGIAKALQGRSGGGSAAIGGPGRSDGGPGGSGRPAPVGGSPGPRLAASTSAPSDDGTALSGSSAPVGGRTLVSVPPLVDDDGHEGDATVAAVADVAVAAAVETETTTGAETDADGDSGEGGGSTAPLLTIVADTNTGTGTGTGTDAVPATGDGSWVQPLEGGECPPGYPVKANDNSGIYHVPGGRSYNRTVAERCYPSAESAEADGYRPAKA